MTDCHSRLMNMNEPLRVIKQVTTTSILSQASVGFIGVRSVRSRSALCKFFSKFWNI